MIQIRLKRKMSFVDEQEELAAFVLVRMKKRIRLGGASMKEPKCLVSAAPTSGDCDPVS
jgi:hypothetical protein